MKETDYGGYPIVLVSYNIKGKINEEKLKNYPVRPPAYCSIQKWIKFENLNTNDRKQTKAIVKETIESIGWYEKQQSQMLDSIFNDNKSFYFSGYYYTEERKLPHSFYDFFYLLDIENNKLYSFKYLRGY